MRVAKAQQRLGCMVQVPTKVPDLELFGSYEALSDSLNSQIQKKAAAAKGDSVKAAQMVMGWEGGGKQPKKPDLQQFCADGDIEHKAGDGVPTLCQAILAWKQQQQPRQPQQQEQPQQQQGQLQPPRRRGRPPKQAPQQGLAEGGQQQQQDSKALTPRKGGKQKQQRK